MLIKDFITLSVYPFLLIVECVRSQQILDGAMSNGPLIESYYKIPDNHFSGRLDFTTTPQYFSCFHLDACRTGLDFCNHRRQACEKCEDYRHACGTNQQNINCTHYCVNLLVVERCLKTMSTKPTTTLTTAEALSENREQTYTPDSLSKLGNWETIVIGILGFALIISFGYNIYLIKRQTKLFKLKELTDEKISLVDVSSSGPSSDESSFIDLNSIQYSSLHSNNDTTGQDSLQPPVSVTPPEIRDKKQQTKVKDRKSEQNFVPSRIYETNIGDEKCERRTTDKDQEMKALRTEIQGQELDTDIQSDSGCISSLPSSPAGIPMIKNSINITISGLNNNSSTLPIHTGKEVSSPKSTVKDFPYSVQETDDNDTFSASKSIKALAQIKHQKPVSDENYHTKIAVGDATGDMDDFNKFSQQSN